jgi:hypothetical protein
MTPLFDTLRFRKALALVPTLLLVCGASLAQPTSPPPIGTRLPDASAGVDAAGYRSVGWSALIPRDWNPSQAFEGIDFSALSDADPRAIESLRKLRQAWDRAPVERSLDQQRIRMSGFLVPLDGEQGAMREFLLVPYYGACIHTPPPPANQIVHVRTSTPITDFKLMDPIVVSGTLRTQVSTTAQGVSGYVMAGDAVIPHPTRRRRP